MRKFATNLHLSFPDFCRSKSPKFPTTFSVVGTGAIFSATAPLAQTKKGGARHIPHYNVLEWSQCALLGTNFAK